MDFVIPKNTKDVVRPEIVNLLCKALFKTKELWWGAYGVYTDGLVGFETVHGCASGHPYEKFTTDERNAAFEKFREAGYHIVKETWYSPKGSLLWCYSIKETKGENGNGQTWLF